MTPTPLPPHAAFELPLWPNGAPTTLQDPQPERWYSNAPDAAFRFRQVRNVSEPTLTAFLPSPQVVTGTAVIVCPGGGHHLLAIDHEGYDVARWLAERGIAAFVLKYRTIPTPDDDVLAERLIQDRLGKVDLSVMHLLTRKHLPHLLADGQRALDLVREHAATWGIVRDRVGMLGFSAGAHLTVSVTLQTAGEGPDFAAPIYGALWEDLTLPKVVPPMFLAYADDDELGAVVVEANLNLYAALHSAGSSVELHVYAHGGHGFGMNRQNLPSDRWIERANGALSSVK